MVKNEYIKIKNGKKEYVRKNKILDAYLKKIVDRQTGTLDIENTGIYQTDNQFSLNHILFKLDTPIEGIDNIGKNELQLLSENENVDGLNITNNGDNSLSLEGTAKEIEGEIVQGTSFTLTDASSTKQASITEIKGNTRLQKLPVEYQEVEYIQSSGTQYIDTGVSPTSDTGFTIEYQEGTGTGTKTLIGSGTSAAVGYIGISRNGTQIQAYWGKPNNVTSYTFTFDTKHKLKFNLNSDRKVVMDGTEIYTLATNPASTITTNTMTLFAFKYTSIVQYANALKLYNCQIYSGSTLVRSFIPCYRKSDNVIGLYDTVGKTFYTNSGTGTFLKGADVTVVTPTPISPVDIITVTGDNNVVVSNKNLLPLAEGTTTMNGLTVTIANGEITLNGTTSASCLFKLTNTLESINGSTIPENWKNEVVLADISDKTLSINYISGTAPSSSCAFRIYSYSHNDQFYLKTTQQTKTYTSSTQLGQDKTISYLTFYTNGNLTFSNYKFNIQIEKRKHSNLLHTASR